MNKVKILVIILFTTSINPLYADANVCNEYKKTTKDYAKCMTGKIKKKFKKFKLNDKLLKFKNSKSHKELIKN